MDLEMEPSEWRAGLPLASGDVGLSLLCRHVSSNALGVFYYFSNFQIDNVKTFLKWDPNIKIHCPDPQAAGHTSAGGGVREAVRGCPSPLFVAAAWRIAFRLLEKGPAGPVLHAASAQKPGDRTCWHSRNCARGLCFGLFEKP